MKKVLTAICYVTSILVLSIYLILELMLDTSNRVVKGEWLYFSLGNPKEKSHHSACTVLFEAAERFYSFKISINDQKNYKDSGFIIVTLFFNQFDPNMITWVAPRDPLFLNGGFCRFFVHLRIFFVFKRIIDQGPNSCTVTWPFQHTHWTESPIRILEW